MNTLDSHLAWIKQSTPAGRKVVIPISGGSDSAFCLWLYAQVFPGQVTGIYHGQDLRQATWFENLAEIIYLDKTPTEIDDWEIYRWAKFLEYSLEHNAVLVGSRTKTEHYLGTFSLASRVASILPLIDLWKSEIMELCEQAGVPEEILLSSQEADPACGRPAELAVISFKDVDSFLKAKLGEVAGKPTISPEQLTYLEGLYQKNLFKQALPLQPA
jgi:NH3-dependent NAD+ synthetase